jgi:hypothetical protein
MNARFSGYVSDQYQYKKADQRRRGKHFGRSLPEAAAFVTLDIKVSTLKRLIGERSLVAEELHCNNLDSKDVVQQAMLASLLLSSK